MYDAALKKGNIPLQAKANGLQLCPIPNQLSGLNMLELRLICLHVPFLKMIALPSGKQKYIHGPAVNVPSSYNYRMGSYTILAQYSIEPIL